MTVKMCRCRIAAVLWFTFVCSTSAEPKTEFGKIELIRDTWGIPHLFSETDAGALYGLGFAIAEERGFQMTYNLRIIQGRLSEVIGVRRKGNRNETSLDNDRKMRTFGWARAAQRTAANLDRETLLLLEAYCDGVNDSFAAQKKDGKLHPLFERYKVVPELWTPSHCLLSWWHVAQFFGTDGTRDLNSWRNRVHPRPGQPQRPDRDFRWIDDATAVVQREDVSEAWVLSIEEFVKQHGPDDQGIGEGGPKFSHAWVVGGKKTTTGAAVLVSDPQTPVRNPSLWMEFHLSGKTLNARGVGIPGSPGLLIGFNNNVAWGLTALGADQADLFRLETDSEHPEQYLWDGEWRKMKRIHERIAVRGKNDVKMVIRETHVGPIVSAFSFRKSGEPEVALKRVPLCDTEVDTIQAVFRMMRAKNASEFECALGDWRFPSANCVYGDGDGNIGYAVLGAIPVRSKQATEWAGREAMPGTGDSWDWQGFVPSELLPRVSNPKSGLLLSANHRPVGSFYRIPLGISTGSMGDTVRSWRLRERLNAKKKFTPLDVLDVHYDTTNPARREIVRLGLHLRKTQRQKMSTEALKALDVLEQWLDSGASSDLERNGAALATRISTFFRMIATPVALQYGGGESGLARFLKDACERTSANPEALLSDDERQFVDTVLANAWRETGGTSARGGRSRNRAKSRHGEKLGWFDSLDGFGSLDEHEDLPMAGITCLDGQTIHSQAAQSYTQWVPLHNVDGAKTICPIGHSDRPNSPYRTSTMDLWGQAKLHPAPLSREAVEAIASARLHLSR